MARDDGFPLKVVSSWHHQNSITVELSRRSYPRLDAEQKWSPLQEWKTKSQCLLKHSMVERAVLRRRNRGTWLDKHIAKWGKAIGPRLAVVPPTFLTLGSTVCVFYDPYSSRFVLLLCNLGIILGLAILRGNFGKGATLREIDPSRVSFPAVDLEDLALEVLLIP
ncbi:hypothetical protein MUK42_10747 [Musa troglodytarum]|uniref:Uncharacterized protein n=1 Tax=Musa troglodytarum TaxID=320322 RepID=A0A9E7JRW0_9LILI|nr:hypothetical protein MUK42_10747 [Musa troglodytarum]